MNIGNRIQAIRKRKGITRLELGNMLHLSEHTIKSYEIGRTDITVNTLFKIADALDVSAASIIMEDDYEILNIVKDYYDLNITNNHLLENDFNLLMQVLKTKYK